MLKNRLTHRLQNRMKFTSEGAYLIPNIVLAAHAFILPRPIKCVNDLLHVNPLIYAKRTQTN